MKDKIIDSLKNKKGKDGAEVFFLLCADASNLNAAFKRTFNASLKHFEAIKKLELEIEDRRQKIKDAYSELTLNPSFAEATAALVAEKNRKESKQQQTLKPPHPPTPSEEGEMGNRKEEVRTSQQQQYAAPPASASPAPQGTLNRRNM